MKLSKLKPILFNTEMVQAILEGRKTTTRRIVQDTCDKHEFLGLVEDAEKGLIARFRYKHFFGDLPWADNKKSKYKVGDVLYVRETWKVEHTYGDELADIRFKANNEIEHLRGLKEETYDKLINFESKNGWQPSLFMPKEAARIFLRVKDVRVERLQDITDEGAKAEGSNVGIGFAEKMRETATDRFIKIWNSTVNKKDLDKYGWNANPYVWVIEFERISKEEVLK